MLKIFKWTVKAIIAGISAYLVLGAFSLVYYNITTFPKFPFYMQAYEGFGYGTFTQDGRMSHLELPNNNKYSVVIMGSSHVEAIQIPQAKTMSYLLNEKLSGLGVYTKSGNAYYLLSQIRDFSSVVKDKNPRYIIMETGTVAFDSASIQRCLDDDISKAIVIDDTNIIASINSNEIIRHIKLLPYIRLLTVQRGNLATQKSVNINSSSSAATQEQLDLLLQKISTMANDNNVKPIIFYHPRLLINEDNSLTTTTDPEKLQQFTSACNKADVHFIDMTDVFMDAYKTSYIFSHGFANTQIESGHMNVDGHRMVATKLSSVILEMEGKS